MPKEELKDLSRFLIPFPENVRAIALQLRDFVWDLYPGANELIYDNYNALAVGFGLSEKAGSVFCSFAVFSKHVNFGFNRGTEIDDPQKLLLGNGSLYRYITVKDTSLFPAEYIQQLLQDAYTNAVSRLKTSKQIISGQTITKSVSPVQRRPK